MKYILRNRLLAVTVAILTAGVVHGQPAVSQGANDDVMRVDEAYRVAKLRQDISALQAILADGFNETNQNGNSRNKAQTIDLWKGFSISSLTTDSFQVSVAGPAAMVTGTQTENGGERMLFSRVYVLGSTGWQLLSSMQFRDPGAHQGLASR
jgi:hypothetical protein